MELIMLGRSWRVWTVLLLMSGVVASLSGTENSPSADEIISKAIARAQQPQSKAGPATYSYTKLTLTEELDAEGNVKDRKERVYQVVLQGGSSCLKLVSVNGRPPTEADLKKQSDNELNARQLGGQSKSGKGDNRENFLT